MYDHAVARPTASESHARDADEHIMGVKKTPLRPCRRGHGELTDCVAGPWRKDAIEACRDPSSGMCTSLC
jgi:hypothetical protein